jgi:hypothetical protein
VENTPAIFPDTNDPDYQKLLAWCVAGKDRLAEIKRFDMPGFQPRRDWVREMERYGILSTRRDVTAPLDPYAVERTYWESLWHEPKRIEPVAHVTATPP